VRRSGFDHLPHPWCRSAPTLAPHPSTLCPLPSTLYPLPSTLPLHLSTLTPHPPPPNPLLSTLRRTFSTPPPSRARSSVSPAVMVLAGTCAPGTHPPPPCAPPPLLPQCTAVGSACHAVTERWRAVPAESRKWKVSAREGATCSCRKSTCGQRPGFMLNHF